MALEARLLQTLTRGNDADAWRAIVDRAIQINSQPLTASNAPSEVVTREREVGKIDLFLSSSAWDLWHAFGNSVERNSQRLIRWWNQPYTAKAVLVLDGLSLRELPWLLNGARERGYALHEVGAYASELPGETSEFARALGFNSRSQLQNNGSTGTHDLPHAWTECVDLPWADCTGLLNSQPNLLFWHHWPDSKLHDGSGAGSGLDTLTKDVAAQLSSSDFWKFVECLAKGRRLVITSDHGYAASGYFPDAHGDAARFLKDTFASGRNSRNGQDPGPFVPPVAMRIKSPRGEHLIALGRLKWRSQGGYPTLTHGGLSVLEVLSPFVELTK
jgi:hypothetical protein